MDRTLVCLLSALTLLLTAAPALADHEHRGSPQVQDRRGDDLDDLARQAARQERRMRANLDSMWAVARQLPPSEARDELMAGIERSTALLDRMAQTDEKLLRVAAARIDRPRGHDGGHQHGWEPPPPRPPTDSEFAGLRGAIERQHFDGERLALAKEIAGSRWFTVGQVRQLVGLMTFSDAKVEIAVFLHGRTLDPENFYLVYDALTFRSDKDELRRRIGRG